MFSIFILLIFVSSAYSFSKPNCEYAGLSCLNCYSQKQCLNWWGLVHWSTIECGSSLTGETNVYCDPNTDQCTSVKPDGCDAISKYTCLRNGILPDSKICTMYHMCINNSAEDFVCEDNYVYKQEYGKCVLKLSDDDCVTVSSCSSSDYTELYPGDSSIYYGCSSSKTFMKACKEVEQYNLNTKACESRCTSAGNLPNSRNCVKYYQCTATDENTYEIAEVSCAEEQGYNPSTKKCDSKYLNICNELYLLENDVYDLIAFTPLIEVILQPIRTVLNYFSISPVKIIFLFGLEDQTLSDSILIIDYIYKNKQLPTTTLGLIVDKIMPYLPSSIQTILKYLLDLGIIGSRSIITENKQPNDIREYLISVLSDVTIDIPQMINSLQGKDHEEISKMIFDQAMKILKIPEHQVPFVALMLQTNLPMVANTLNQNLGVSLFSAKENILKLNQNAVDTLVYKQLDDIASKMYPQSTFLGGLFKTIAKHRYMMNHGVIENFVDNFYFTASGLI